MTDKRSEILQGTLDLMVLKTLDAMGPMHGYGIALRIEQLSGEALRINQGTIYLCLIRLVQKGWIKPNDLYAMLQKQVEEIFYNTLAMSKGTFLFARGIDAALQLRRVRQLG